MSIAMTIRRADPRLVDRLSGEDAIGFALGLEDGKVITSDDVIPFFDAWHIVHFLSSGTEWDRTLPAGFMVGGEEWVQVDPEEEPLRLLNRLEVKAAAQHLIALPSELVDARLAVLASGNPNIYYGRIGIEEFDEYRAILDDIKRFFTIAAAHGMLVTKAMG